MLKKVNGNLEPQMKTKAPKKRGQKKKKKKEDEPGSLTVVLTT